MKDYGILEIVCPNGHTILSMAYSAELSQEKARGQLERFVKERLNPWCNLCKSRELTIREKPTVRINGFHELVPPFVNEQLTAIEKHAATVKGN